MVSSNAISAVRVSETVRDDARWRKVVSLLLAVADHELLTHQIYRRLRDVTSDDLPELSGLTHTASDEDWEHYHSVLSCARRLSSETLEDAQPYPPVDARGLSEYPVVDLLWLLRTTERQLVESYHEICRLTIERDYRTFDLSFRNLNENAQHQQRVSDLLSTGWARERRPGRHLELVGR